VDLFSTILDLAGVPIPKEVPDKNGKPVKPDGVSMLPVLFNGAKQLRDPYTGYQLAETMNPVKQNTLSVAARNTRYKVLCANDANDASCEFYDLVDDPLEEYKLPKPASCADYGKAMKQPSAEWSYCRLHEVLAKESILSQPKPAPAPARGQGGARQGGARPGGPGPGGARQGPPPAGQ
jgi:arylsulfatase A-like enzyme